MSGPQGIPLLKPEAHILRLLQASKFVTEQKVKAIGVKDSDGWVEIKLRGLRPRARPRSTPYAKRNAVAVPVAAKKKKKKECALLLNKVAKFQHLRDRFEKKRQIGGDVLPNMISVVLEKILPVLRTDYERLELLWGLEKYGLMDILNDFMLDAPFNCYAPPEVHRQPGRLAWRLLGDQLARCHPDNVVLAEIYNSAQDV